MFGLGFPEIVFIFVVAAIVLGPEHMPRAANLLGKWSAKLRSAATSFGEAIANDEDLREIKTTVDEVKTEIDSVKSEFVNAKREVLEISGTAQSAFEEARRELRSLGRMDETGEKPESFSSDEDLSVSSDVHADVSVTCSLQRAVQTEASSDLSEPVLCRIHLARPILLPGEISRKVSRFRIPVSAVSSEAKPESQHSIVLAQVNPCTPFLRIRRLDKAAVGCTEALRIVRLTAADMPQEGRVQDV